jgi:arylsulfatase A-like enzyme
MKHDENAGVLHEKAVAFIKRNKDRPFFLYYAPNNVHTPLTPNKRFQGTSQCGAYGDFVHELDWTVGEVLATLDRLGLAENTLVIFTSDNGGRYEMEAVEAGHRCDAPLNGQKADVWDGGNRVPFLARWPGRIPPGATSDRLLCLTDVLATFAALADQTLPPEAGPDSINALPLLLKQPPSDGDRRNLIVQSGFAVLAERKHIGPGDLWAVREGDWLLVMGQGSGNTTARELKPRRKRKGHGFYRFGELGFVNSDFTPDGKLKPDAPPMQLYDLAADLGQTKNLYREHPDIVARLNKLFDELVKNGRSRP